MKLGPPHRRPGGRATARPVELARDDDAPVGAADRRVRRRASAFYATTTRATATRLCPGRGRGRRPRSAVLPLVDELGSSASRSAASRSAARSGCASPRGARADRDARRSLHRRRLRPRRTGTNVPRRCGGRVCAAIADAARALVHTGRSEPIAQLPDECSRSTRPRATRGAARRSRRGTSGTTRADRAPTLVVAGRRRPGDPAERAASASRAPGRRATSSPRRPTSRTSSSRCVRPPCFATCRPVRA